MPVLLGTAAQVDYVLFGKTLSRPARLQFSTPAYDPGDPLQANFQGTPHATSLTVAPTGDGAAAGRFMLEDF